MQKILSTNLEAGVAVALTDNITRVVAGNGNAMTGPGTNTYLLGKDELAVVDPGPISGDHIDAILRAAESLGEIRYVLLTHTHGDHSPGVVDLVKATQARTALFPKPSGDPFSDTPVPADVPLLHDDVLPDFPLSIQAVHTPGHASNHLCFYVPDDKALLTGDHIMNGSSVVIAPPDGNMTEYLQSLELVNEYDIEYLLPGHGSVMPEPQKVVEHTVKHRMGREAKVIKALVESKTGKIDDVLSLAYDDTPSFLHGMALMSLTAHLQKLEREQKAQYQDDIWRIC